MSNELIPGFDKEKESIMEKIMEAIDGYILSKLKLDQLRRNQNRTVDLEKELEHNMLFHKDQMSEIILQDADLQWLKPPTKQ